MISAELNVFRELFASGPSNLELMNRTLPAVMRVIQDALREAVVLGLSRLGDRASQGRFRNLTFDSLVVAVRDDGSSALAESLQTHLADFDCASANLRDWRNKSIAHSDRAVGEGRIVLPPLPTAELEKALGNAGDFLNEFSYATSRSRTSYAETLFSNDSPFELLRRLRESERYRQEHPRTWMQLPTLEGNNIDDAVAQTEAVAER